MPKDKFKLLSELERTHHQLTAYRDAAQKDYDARWASKAYYFFNRGQNEQISMSFDTLIKIPNSMLGFAELKTKISFLNAEISSLESKMNSLAEDIVNEAETQRLSANAPVFIETHLQKKLYKDFLKHSKEKNTAKILKSQINAQITSAAEDRDARLKQQIMEVAAEVAKLEQQKKTKATLAKDVLAKLQEKQQIKAAQELAKAAREKEVLEQVLADNAAGFIAELNTTSQKLIDQITFDIEHNKFKRPNEFNSEAVAATYATAEKVIIVSKRMTLNTAQLWKSWDIINVAHLLKNAEINSKPPSERTEAELKELQEYAINSKRILRFLLNDLPLELQPLKVLFEISDHMIVADLLREYFAFASLNNPAKLNAFIDKLRNKVEGLYLERAKKSLYKKYPEFSDLAPEVQNALIEQRAFIIMLTAYYDFSGNKTDLTSKELRDYITSLKNNIEIAMQQQNERVQVVKQGVAEFKVTQKNLENLDQKIRLDFLIDKAVDTIVNTPGAVIKIAKEYMLGDGSETSTERSPFDSKAYVMGAEFVNFAYRNGVLPSPATVVGGMSVLMGIAVRAAAMKMVMEANTLVIPEIESQLAELNKIPAFDAAYLHKEDEYWHKIKALESTSDITKIKNEYFEKKYDATKEVLKTFIYEKGAELNIVLKDLANESTSSTKELVFTALKVMSGVAPVVTIGLMIVFVLSGLTGPFLLFAFVPALSTSIICALALTAAKMHFEGNKTATDLNNWLIWLAYSPVLFTLNAVEFLLKPVTLTMAMLQTDSDGNAPSRSSKAMGVATIVLAIALAVGLGFGFPVIAPAIGISAGIAITIGVIVGAYTGLSLGALAKKAFERFQNRPKVKISKARKELEALLHIENANKDKMNNNSKLKNFEDNFPEIAPDIVKLLQARFNNLQLEVDALELKLQRPSDKPVNVTEIHEQISAIASKITTLQTSWDVLFDTFENYNTYHSRDNALIFAAAIEDILYSEYEIARSTFEAASLERVKRATDPQYQKEIRPSIIFNKDPNSFKPVKAPAFEVPNPNDHAKQREKLNQLHALEEKSRKTLKNILR